MVNLVVGFGWHMVEGGSCINEGSGNNLIAKNGGVENVAVFNVDALGGVWLRDSKTGDVGCFDFESVNGVVGVLGCR